MVADWHCIVRNLMWVTDSRVKPGHDDGSRVGIFGGWCNVTTMNGTAIVSVLKMGDYVQT
jgi:hypothetical protein